MRGIARVGAGPGAGDAFTSIAELRLALLAWPPCALIRAEKRAPANLLSVLNPDVPFPWRIKHVDEGDGEHRIVRRPADRRPCRLHGDRVQHGDGRLLCSGRRLLFPRLALLRDGLLRPWLGVLFPRFAMLRRVELLQPGERLLCER